MYPGAMPKKKGKRKKGETDIEKLPEPPRKPKPKKIEFKKKKPKTYT